MPLNKQRILNWGHELEMGSDITMRSSYIFSLFFLLTLSSLQLRATLEEITKHLSQHLSLQIIHLSYLRVLTSVGYFATQKYFFFHAKSRDTWSWTNKKKREKKIHHTHVMVTQNMVQQTLKNEGNMNARAF